MKKLLVDTNIYVKLFLWKVESNLNQTEMSQGGDKKEYIGIVYSTDAADILL